MGCIQYTVPRIQTRKVECSYWSPVNTGTKDHVPFHKNTNILWKCAYFNTGLRIRSSVFWANHSFFAQKWANERFAQKNKWIARFLPKNERMSDSLQKRAIRSFAHFWWATWAIGSCSLIYGKQPERFAHIAQFWWATWAIHSHHSPKKREWAIRSFFKSKTIYKTY